MSTLGQFSASVFAGIAYAVLAATGWKKKTVKANLKYVQDTMLKEILKQVQNDVVQNVVVKHDVVRHEPLQNRELYKKLLKNLTRHVGEMLFCFDTYKKLPENCAAYPCKRDGWNFEIAEGAAPVIETMRRGGIFLTAHYGNYEASGAWLCALGVPLKASFIPLKPAWLNRMVYKKIRCVKGRPYSIDAKTPREFLAQLDGKAPDCNGQKQLFCLLADQDSRINSAMDGTFLGRPAKINPLPDFLLKHRPDTPVFFCWIEETRDSSRGINKKILHAVEAAKYQPEHTTSLSDADLRQHDIQKNTCRSIVDGPYRKWLEERIRENPSLWYGWTHRRFKSMNPEIYG